MPIFFSLRVSTAHVRDKIAHGGRGAVPLFFARNMPDTQIANRVTCGHRNFAHDSRKDDIERSFVCSFTSIGFTRERTFLR